VLRRAVEVYTRRSVLGHDLLWQQIPNRIGADMADEFLLAVQSVLDGFESAPDTFLEVAVADSLRTASTNLEPANQGECDTRWAESAAMSFYRRPNGEASVWGTTYGPMMSATKEDGTSFYTPDIREADEATIEYWKKRSLECKQPILRARYSDLVWDLSRIVANQKPDVSFAKRAIDAYIEASKLSYKIAVQPIHYTERALTLATSIGDEERIGRVVDAMFDLYDRVAQPELLGSWPFLFDNLLDNKKIMIKLTNAQQERIIRSLEEILQRSVDRSAPKEFNPWGAQGAAERLAGIYRRSGAKEEVQRVIRAYGMAFEKLAEEASPTLALGWLQPVYGAYLNAGMRDDAHRVQLASEQKGKRAHEDMKEISARVEISEAEVEEFVKAITADSLDLAYKRIAVQFLTRATAARNFLKEMTHQAPLVSMIGIQRISDGHIAAQAGSVESDPDGRLIMQLAQMIEMESPFLSTALDKTHELYKPTAKQVADFLRQSPLFTPEAESLLTEGIEAYLNGDHVKAIHIFIPQIEAALRGLLGLLGLPTNKPMRSSKGVMQAKNLNDVLGDSNINKILGDDAILYLRTFLNDPRGQNIRNRISHGLTEKRYLSRPLADRVFHVVLVLSMIRKEDDLGIVEGSRSE
jgi:lysyl-tRNA synthetase class 1